MRTMQRLIFVVGLAVACLAMCPHGSHAVASVVQLPPFNSVKICAPFGATITPGQEPSLSLDADKSVKDAVTTTIDKGVLTIGTSQVTVAPGFTPAKSFQASISGSGNLFIQDLTVDTLTLSNDGSGQLYVKGSAKQATVSANGAGTTYVGGGQIGQVTANVGGVGQLIVDPRNADTQITGSTQLLGKIMYTAGSCTLEGSTVPGVTNNPAAAAVSQLLGTNPFGQLTQSSCTKVANSPVSPPTMKDTCGLRVQGTFDCSGSFTGGSSASTSGGGTSSMSSNGDASTSTSGNGVAFATGGLGQSVSSGPGQSSSIFNNGAVQTLPCNKQP